MLARVELVVEGEEEPANLHSKAALAQAQVASGLRLALKVGGWAEQGESWVRECVLVGDNAARIAELFPSTAVA